MDFEVAIRALPEPAFDPDLANKIIMLPLPNMPERISQMPPPPLAA